MKEDTEIENGVKNKTEAELERNEERAQVKEAHVWTEEPWV